jgi:hypothetical protein
VSQTDGYIITETGQRRNKRTTKGWELLVEWKDGSVTWIPLKDLKETNPVEVAEYAIANRIKHEPAFAWWVNTVIRRRERIVAKMQKKYWRTEYKFGVRLPKTVDEALQIDKMTGTDHWERAIKKEMSKVNIAYNKAKEGVTPEDVRQGKVMDMRGFQEIKCHIVFDVKMDFTRKARFVAGGHMTQPAASITETLVGDLFLMPGRRFWMNQVFTMMPTGNHSMEILKNKDRLMLQHHLVCLLILLVSLMPTMQGM